jgi:serine/threonine protein kinase
LLSKCLKINYNDRLSADKLLESPLFECIHNAESAKVTKAPNPIEIRLDEMMVENDKRQEYTVSQLKKYIVQYV